MLVRRLGLAMAVGAVAAASLVSSPATAAAAPAAPTQVAAHSAAAAAPSSALRRHKQKKLRLSLTINRYAGTAWEYAFTVTTKRGVPVAGVKFKPQYHATKRKWSNEGITYVSDANGRFSLIGCSLTSNGVERMHSKATRRHKEVSLKYVLNHCG